MSDTSSAEGATDNLQASAASLASDPVSNLSQLPRLQSAQSDRHQQIFASCMACVLSKTVVHSKSNTLQFDADALHAMVAATHRNDPSSALQHDEKSRVALAVLLLGVWADKLPARLEHTKVSEGGEDNQCSSGQVAAGDSSAVPALAHAPAAAAATSASASSSTSSSCAPAAVSASSSASDSASESAGRGEVALGSPCSATAVAVFRPLPCLMHQLSLRASDIEEEEEAEEELEWVPCSLDCSCVFVSSCTTCAIS